MKSVTYINPEGAEVEVPEADAAHFDAKGWQRVDAAPKKGNKNKNNEK